ncbi:MAG: hypothetical protein PF488_00565 [Patescibacteria group bacterium]|jgi:hypothetical protein|nr:hypothetical protein [Patescibacteria group bacterium]
MCRKNKGIATVYQSFSGRIKNIRVNDKNEIVADFYERTAKTPRRVLVSELKFTNKKAKNTFSEIIKTLTKKKSKSSAEVIMS